MLQAWAVCQNVRSDLEADGLALVIVEGEMNAAVDSTESIFLFTPGLTNGWFELVRPEWLYAV
jgi:hypothetical protein